MQGPDHLTFDLADQSRMSLSFYGKRPGPGMQLEKRGTCEYRIVHHPIGGMIDFIQPTNMSAHPLSQDGVARDQPRRRKQLVQVLEDSG